MKYLRKFNENKNSEFDVDKIIDQKVENITILIVDNTKNVSTHRLSILVPSSLFLLDANKLEDELNLLLSRIHIDVFENMILKLTDDYNYNIKDIVSSKLYYFDILRSDFEPFMLLVYNTLTDYSNY